jgi:RNA polymerase-binding transcription factor DksA
MYNAAEAEARLNRLAIQHRGSPMADAVRAALDKVHTGHYGVCEECGASIEIRTLEDRPWARTCRSCQNRIETAEIPHSNLDSRSLDGTDRTRSGRGLDT